MKKRMRDEGTDHQIEGGADQVKGRARNAVGGLTGNSSQQLRGKAEELKGKVQRKIGEVQRNADKNERGRR